MAKKVRVSSALQEAAKLGLSAARSGDLDLAREQLEKAVQNKPEKHLAAAINLAIVCEQMGEHDESARLYTQMLRHHPTEERALGRFSSLARRFTFSNPDKLDSYGLLATMNAPLVDPQTLFVNVLNHLKATTELGPFLAAPDANIISSRTPKWLTNPLLIELLEKTLVTDPALEDALTNLRNAIPELESSRFTDRSLTTFLLALADQCDRNEQIFMTPETVLAKLNDIRLSYPDLISGDRDQATAFLIQALFKPPLSLLPPTAIPDNLARVRPEPLRVFFQNRLRNKATEDTLQRSIGSGKTPTDDTSRRVAQQYEVNPYPKWESIQLPPSGWLIGQLDKLLQEHDTHVLHDRFDVLIAGCGTGRQACQSARGYGDKATVTATDLSVASLAYAARKADEFGLTNIEFRQQNILDLDPSEHQYDVIECLGVLHHMADPLIGWSKLNACLKPGGIMQIALYSTIARQDVTAMRNAPDYPGPNASADETRRYRHYIRALPDSATGGNLKYSPDFYSLSTFRDLMLHQSEQTFELPQIAEFLHSAGLTFGGFVIDSVWLEDFLDTYPDETIPGRLATWDQYERANPRLFEGMYQFWVTKPDL